MAKAKKLSVVNLEAATQQPVVVLSTEQQIAQMEEILEARRAAGLKIQMDIWLLNKDLDKVNAEIRATAPVERKYEEYRALLGADNINFPKHRVMDELYSARKILEQQILDLREKYIEFAPLKPAGALIDKLDAFKGGVLPFVKTINGKELNYSDARRTITAIVGSEIEKGLLKGSVRDRVQEILYTRMKELGLEPEKNAPEAVRSYFLDVCATVEAWAVNMLAGKKQKLSAAVEELFNNTKENN